MRTNGKKNLLCNLLNIKSQKLLFIYPVLLLTPLLGYSQFSISSPNSFMNEPIDTNRSVMYGYFEIFDDGYDFVDGDQEYMDVQMLNSSSGVMNFIRTCNKESAIKLSEEKKIRTGKLTNTVETSYDLLIKRISFNCYNCNETKSFTGYLQKVGNGYLFFVTNVSFGNWEIKELNVAKEKKSPDRIYKRISGECPDFHDYLPLSRDYYQYFFNKELVNKLAVRVKKHDVYYLGSFQIRQSRNYKPIITDSTHYDPCSKKPQINNIDISYSADTLSFPNKKYLLQKLDTLSRNTRWNNMIINKITNNF
jgi:hypothetical protein